MQKDKLTPVTRLPSALGLTFRDSWPKLLATLRAAGRGGAPSCKAARSHAAVFWNTVPFLNLRVVPAFAGRVLVPGESRVDGVSYLLRVPAGWLGLSWAGWKGQDCPLEGPQGARGAPAVPGARH